MIAAKIIVDEFRTAQSWSVYPITDETRLYMGIVRTVTYLPSEALSLLTYGITDDGIDLFGKWRVKNYHTEYIQRMYSSPQFMVWLALPLLSVKERKHLSRSIQSKSSRESLHFVT